MMFRRVASDVNAQTGGRQRPETYISLLSEFYLNQADRIVWDSIKDRGDAAALRNFVNKYPASPFVMALRDRLALLEREELVRREEGLRNAVRELVEPHPFNLVTDNPGMPPMDLVLLRNVLPQFEPATRERVLGKIARVLAVDGYLVLGEGETPRPLDDTFEPIPDSGGFLFGLRGG